MHVTAGGPPVVIRRFIEEATNLGHSSEIISTTLFCAGDESVLLDELNGIAKTTLLSSSKLSLLLSPAAKEQISRSVSSAHIVHLHTCWSPLNVLVNRECARRHRPYVLMPHGYLDPYSLRIKRWPKKAYLWAVEHKILRGAKRLVYTTSEEMRLACSAISPLPPGVVIPLGGDAPPIESTEVLARQFQDRFPRVRGRRQLLFIGRVDFKKGIDRILLALPSIVKEHPDVLLTIAGSGSPEFKAKLELTIDAASLGNHVLFTGWLEGAEKWGAYASATVFLLPSRQDNFAITVAEAMHMGVPVIISNRVNTWPIVTTVRAGIILDDEDIGRELEANILLLLKCSELRRRMSKRGQEHARRHLTWSQATRKLLECYDHVLSFG
jgi:glycosyltransferase involved in cell wall biosynthesis